MLYQGNTIMPTEIHWVSNIMGTRYIHYVDITGAHDVIILSRQNLPNDIHRNVSNTIT